MKKVLPVTIIVALLAAVLAVGVSAQGTESTQAPGLWSSSINIQNVGSGPATVVIKFYTPSGTEALSYTVTPAIPAGGSRSLYVPSQIPGLTSGQYSVVVSSDEMVQVIANAASSTPYTAGAYNGIASSEVGTTLYFPGLYKNYYQYWSEVVLQNAEAAVANLTLRFYNQKTGAQVGGDITATIPANGSRVFALQNLSGLTSGNSGGLYSLQVTSDRNLAGVANTWSQNIAKGIFADYNAFVRGTTTVYAPSLLNSYYGYVSSLTVQNVGASAADVLVTYSNGVTETVTLQPRTAKEYYQPNNTALPTGNRNGVFSAKIECLNGQPLVAMVNEVQPSVGLYGAYNAPSVATTSVNTPLVMREYYGWFTAVTVQNVGAVATDITITFAASGNPSQTFSNVPANGTVNMIQLAEAGTTLPAKSAVSAVITASQPVVAVVQEENPTARGANAGDYLQVYTGYAN